MLLGSVGAFGRVTVCRFGRLHPAAHRSERLDRAHHRWGADGGGCVSNGIPEVSLGYAQHFGVVAG